MIPENNTIQIVLFLTIRVRLVRQPSERPHRHSSHERLPDRNEAAEGPTEAAERHGPPLLATGEAHQRCS